MRRTPSIAVVALVALVAAGCGTDDEDDGREAADGRVAELEEALADAERRAEELGADNAGLETQLEAARSGQDGDADPAETDTDSPPRRPQPIRSAEGLPEQLRLLFGAEELPEGHEPGTTDWRPRELPAGLAATYDEPGVLALDLARILDAEALGAELWETTTRVLLDPSDADQAYVAVLSWGMADDAVIGRDLRVIVTRGEDGWQPTVAEERDHCQRGVDGDLCV